jgi:zinc protease
LTFAPDRTRPPAPGPEVDVPMPTLERRVVAHGPPIYLAQRRDVPLVEVELMVDAGGEHNPDSRPGLASMTASMLDEGTVRRSGPELSTELERRGGSLSCHADWNAARVRLQLHSADLDFGMELLAELLFEPAFPVHELERLRQQTLAELKRRSDHAAAVADEAFAFHLFAGSPFAHPISGNRAALEAMSREDLIEFHRRRYLDGRGAIAVAGDFDAARLAEAVAERFASLPASEVPRPAPETVVADGADGAKRLQDSPRGLRVVVVDRPGAEQTELRIGHSGVPRRHPDRVGLGVLNALLGGKFTSRINLNLRERNGFTYGASSRFVDRRSRGPFLVSTAVNTASASRAAEEVLGELRRLRDEPVPSAELEETRNYLLGVFPYGLQTIEGLAARLDEIAVYDLPLDTPARYLADVAAIRTDEISRLARIHLHPDAALIVAVGPAEELTRQLRGIAEPELWRSSALDAGAGLPGAEPRG